MTGLPLSIQTAQWLTSGLGLYLLAGLVFMVAFQLRGLAHLGPAAANGSRGFRLLIAPGLVGLWPWMLRIWLRGSVPEARTAHTRPAAKSAKT